MGQVLFAGDTYLKKGTNGKRVTDELLKVCGEYDFFCANIEGPAGNYNFESNLGFKFRDNQIDEIAKSGVDVGILGNNHIYDCGNKGLRETLKQCEECGIKTVGADIVPNKIYNPLILTTSDGYKIAVFSVQHRYYGSALYDCESGVADIWNNKFVCKIIEIRNVVDYIVVNAHCGLENNNIPLNTWREKYRFLIDVGADLIVGHHPHIIQCVEEYKGKSIVYSIGNFAFDLEDKYKNIVSSNWYRGIVLSVVFFGKNKYRLNYIIGTYIDGNFKVDSVENELVNYENVFNKEKYNLELKNEFNEYLKHIRSAICKIDIDYKTLYHYLALDEQKNVIQEYLELNQSINYEEGNKVYELNIYPIIIWGYGKTGINFYNYAKKRGYRILGFTDSFVKEETIIDINGDKLIIYNAEYLSILNKKYNLIIASIYEKEIRIKIESLKLDCNIFVADELYWHCASQSINSWKKMDWNYNKEIRINRINYRIFEKDNNSPIILYLHGAGACGQDNMQQISNMGNMGKALMDYANLNSYSIYVPQCPISSMWVEIDYKQGYFIYDDINNNRSVLDSVLEYIKELSENRDIFLVGYSIGGYAGWLSLMKFPEMFKKAILVSCGGDPNYNFKNDFGEKILLVHGERDNDVPVSGSRTMAKLIDCKYYEFSEYGHNITYDLSKERWLDIIKEGFE